MRRHDDPAIQAVYERWNTALADRADHELSCDVCVPFSWGNACPEGQRLAGVEQGAYRAWSEARSVGVAS